MKPLNVDVAVVGAGVAGLSAALTLARARRKVQVVDAGSPRNRFASHAHGLLTREGIGPQELLELGRSEVEAFGGEIVRAKANSITENRSGKSLTILTDSQSIRADAVIIATGITDVLPSIPGVEDHWGETVHHCSYCHGAELDPEKAVAVLGGENKPFILKQAKLLTQWNPKVSLITCGMSLSKDERDDLLARGISVDDRMVTSVSTSSTNDSVLAINPGDTMTVGAVFVGPSFQPNDDLLRKAGCARDGQGWTTRDQFGRTSIEGIWAAGNVVTSSAQLVNAAAEGATAAININDTLLGLA
ncbi:NAD(P)/FAD-dependent oxidoreductase [Brevibacterium renqingii]|uniref:NAD(P)/FAD-dependent oxidoreductase n=1 Tax=Brevibacterium renqingii TaxID=2776916 RepID=UPI001ADFA71C